MATIEQTIMREVAALPPSRRTDVLAFVRYLRVSLMDDDDLERQYDAAVTKIRETARRYHLTEEDVAAEVRAVRDEHARGA